MKALLFSFLIGTLSITGVDQNPKLAEVRKLMIKNDDNSVQALIAILQTDPESSVREAAVSALGRIRDKHAVRPLIDALNDFDLIPKTATKSLRRITKQFLDSDYNKWKSWWEQEYGAKSKELELTLKSIKKLKIVIDQQYEGEKRDIISFDNVTDWLQSAGIEIETVKLSQDYDAMLTIKIIGEAVSREYLWVYQDLFTGASVKGIITLSVHDNNKYISFRGRKIPPKDIRVKTNWKKDKSGRIIGNYTDDYSKPSDAPFEEALFSSGSESFPERFSKLINECLGKDISEAIKDH